MTQSDTDESKAVFSTAREDFAYLERNIPCQAACPAGTNIPAYIRALFEGNYGRSYDINRDVNILPGVLGRICSRPCEESCRHGERGLGEPVNICHIKRAAADLRPDGDGPSPSPLSLGVKAAVVGSGPAGLAAAHDLALAGAEVTIFEALDLPGGMLRYGIPEFRLPRNVLDAEIDHILRLGVTLRTGQRFGDNLAPAKLLDEHDAVILAAGCYRSNSLQVEGEDLAGVLSGLELMMDVSASRPPKIGERVLVIGDGFTAFDCARTALRLGAKDVRICSRLTRDDLIVTKDEIVEAEREGVRFEFLLTAVKVAGEGKVAGVEFLRTRPGDSGADGRREADPIEGSAFTLAADTVVVAIGQRPEPLAVPGEEPSDKPVAADRESFRAVPKGLYVAGDYLSGPSTVIEAVAMGRKAAWKVVQDLTGRAPRRRLVRVEETEITDRERTWDFLPRQDMPVIPLQGRFSPREKEVELGFDRETAKKESQRCYLCYLHYEIDMDRCIYCRYCIDVAPRDCIKLVREVRTDDDGAVVELVETENWHDVNAVVIDNERCIRCGACLRVCPVECISVAKVELVERPGGEDRV